MHCLFCMNRYFVKNCIVYKGDKMISFASDYIAGAHPEILRRLTELNLETLPGYGTDKYCESAKAKIKEKFDCPNADVHFLVGGTQANQVVISTVLAPYEGVISIRSGHVNGHEAGAIEFSGHKVLVLDGPDGKLTAEGVDKYVTDFYADENYEHMVQPGMVYITYPTEYGTLYTKEELKQLYDVCKKHNLPLFIDGARLGYGLASEKCDITPAELSKLCDIFYVGGTKMGALVGEAVVFCGIPSPKHYLSQIKQHGALLAKGRVLGIQFDTLFTDDLYMEIGKYADELAVKLKDVFVKKGYRLYMEAPTNQQFVIIDNAKLEELSKNVVYTEWEKYDTDSTVIRFVTSWSTHEEDIEELEKYL